jgi:hypothetical protein
LLEATSSGLSHVQPDFFPFAERMMTLNTPRFYKLTDPFMELNFGEIEITEEFV